VRAKNGKSDKNEQKIVRSQPVRENGLSGVNQRETKSEKAIKIKKYR
jgi:hypothetical protein